MTQLICLLLIASITFTASAGTTIREMVEREERVEGTVDGKIVTFRDGVVECVLYRAWQSAAIQCSAKGKVDLERLPENSVLLKNYAIVRRIVNGKLCYIYDNTKNADISCL